MKIYVSGPMRGLPDHGKAGIAQAGKILEAEGHEVFTPGGKDFERLSNDVRSIFLMDMVAILSWADAVVVHGREWQKSRGCVAEVSTAIAAVMPVWELVQHPAGTPMLYNIVMRSGHFHRFGPPLPVKNPN